MKLKTLRERAHIMHHVFNVWLNPFDRMSERPNLKELISKEPSRPNND